MKAPWIIKAGGELVGDAAVRRKILRGLAEASRRNPVIFFHGGGPQIEAELKRNNVAAHFVGGRRVTTPAAMVHVERILSGEINKGLAGELLALGVRAAGLSCRDGGIVIGKPLPKLGRAAKPVKVKADLLWSLLKTRFTPVVSTVGGDARGAAVNINADDAASAVAVNMKAARLVFLTNVSGVRGADGQRIPVLRIGDIDKLIDTGVITGGMIPKVQSARAAINRGVGEVDIVNGLKGLSTINGTRIVK